MPFVGPIQLSLPTVVMRDEIDLDILECIKNKKALWKRGGTSFACAKFVTFVFKRMECSLS